MAGKIQPLDVSRNELKMFHKQILSRILVCSSIFRNSRYQCSGSVLLLPETLNKWTREKKVSAFSLFHWNKQSEFPRKSKNIFFHFATRWTVCTLARIVFRISPATICCRWFCPHLHLIPVWLNSPFPIITKKLSKIFSNTERRKLCSVRNGSSVSTAVNERGEGTVVAVRAYLFRCTSFPLYDCVPKTTEKETGFSVSKQSQAPK